MNPVTASFIGLLDFMFKFIITMYLLRMAAVKLHNRGAGQGLGALVF